VRDAIGTLSATLVQPLTVGGRRQEAALRRNVAASLDAVPDS
jgi:hypothetical protein